MASRRKDGRMTYLTAFQLAKSKAKTSAELEIIYRAIGPKPLTLDNLQERRRSPENRVPYLGDWQQIRAKAYFNDNESVEKMKKVVAERLDGLEAGRGAATIVLDVLGKWMEYDGQRDEMFGGNLVVGGLSDKQQNDRANRFYRLKERSLKGLMFLIDKYLSCHGISSENGMNDLGQLVMAVSNASARQVLTGAAAGMALGGGQESPALLMLARAINDKARTRVQTTRAARASDHSPAPVAGTVEAVTS